MYPEAPDTVDAENRVALAMADSGIHKCISDLAEAVAKEIESQSGH